MRWVLLVASVVLSLLVGEYVARLLVDELSLERRLRGGGLLIPFAPDAEADLLTDEFRVRYRINRFGYRDRPTRHAARTPGVPRIALLGDSFAAGWGVEFDETFGDRLERATGIEVVNAAKHGGCPLWFVAQARYVREHLSPDWLLVQIFDNDPGDNTLYRRDFGLELGDRFEALPPELLPSKSVAWRLAHVFESSVLHRRLRQLSRRIRGEKPSSTPYVKPGAKPEQRILTREEAIAKHKVEFSFGRPPHPAFSYLDPAQREAWRARLEWNAQLLDQLIEEAAAAGVPVALLHVPVRDVFLREPAPHPLVEAARKVRIRHDVMWLDARDAFALHPRPWDLYYAYDGHLNASGHAAVAEMLVRDLAPRVRGAAAPRMTDERTGL